VPAYSYGAIPLDHSAQTEEIAQNDVVKKKHKSNWVKEFFSRPKNPSINGLLSMIFGIGSIVLFPPLAIPGLILGIIALNKREPKEWMGIVGVSTSGLVLLLAILAIILFFFILV
jgi:hypothetical protein